MTMIDDDTLSRLFARAAEAMPVPESGPADILEKAFASTGALDEGDTADDTPDSSVGLDELVAPRARRVAKTLRSHRLLSVAAVVVLAFVAVGSVTWLGSSPTTHTVAAGLHGSSASGAKRAIAPGLPNSAASVPPAAGATTGGSATGGNSSVNGGGTTFAPAPLQSAPTPAASGAGATNTAPALPNNAFQSARVEQTGSLSLTVKKGSLTTTLTKLGFLAAGDSGFVANSQTQAGAVANTGAPSGTITLQVPVSSFSDLLKKAQALGKTDDLTTKASDVTGQYVDLQSRIAALQDSRQQYLTIMAKATSVGDVLAVQSQLNTIQSQIEQLQGQLNLLTAQTTYSTLNVQVTERSPGGQPTHPAHRSGLSKAWHDSVHGFVVGVEGIIRLAGPVLFTLLCAAVLIFGGRLLWRRYQRHNL